MSTSCASVVSDGTQSVTDTGTAVVTSAWFIAYRSHPQHGWSRDRAHLDQVVLADAVRSRPDGRTYLASDSEIDFVPCPKSRAHSTPTGAIAFRMRRERRDCSQV